jgi:hypothetical protein
VDFTEWRFLSCRRLVEDWGSVFCTVIQGVEYYCDENHALEEWIAVLQQVGLVGWLVLVFVGGAG